MKFHHLVQGIFLLIMCSLGCLDFLIKHGIGFYLQTVIHCIATGIIVLQFADKLKEIE